MLTRWPDSSTDGSACSRALAACAAALGVISVASALPELKMQRLFAEGFGIVGGAIGGNR